MHVSASISVSLYLYHDDFFFLLFLPAPSIKRTRTHFSPPPSPSRVRHPCSTKTTLIVRFALLFLSPSSPSRSFSVQLARILSDTHSWTLAHTVLRLLTLPPAPLSYHRPYLRPWPSCVHACRLSPSIASVYTRALPLFIAEQRRTQRYRVCARERCGEREAGRV